MSELSDWRPMKGALVDGTIADLRFRDCLGAYELAGCFLHDDGCWYLIDPPRLIEKQPIAWRPSAAGAGQGEEPSKSLGK